MKNNKKNHGCKTVRSEAEALALIKKQSPFCLSHSITTLNFANHLIGDFGTQLLGNALQHLSCLTQLDLTANQIGGGARDIAQSLLKNTSLTTLHLEWNQIGKEEARDIAQSLLQNSSLTKLYLGGNKIGEEGTREIAHSLLRNSTLVTLDVGRNQIGEGGAREIAKCLLRNSSLTKLDVGSNMRENRREERKRAYLSILIFFRESTRRRRFKGDCAISFEQLFTSNPRSSLEPNWRSGCKRHRALSVKELFTHLT